MRHTTTAALALATLLCTEAAAQVKPKIYIVFDTSGTMMYDTGGELQFGDGSPLCHGDGQTSRIYQLKQAFFEVLQGMGANEIDFALATFPMVYEPGRTPLCAHGSGPEPTTCNQSSRQCPRPEDTCGFPPGLFEYECVNPCIFPQNSCSGLYRSDPLSASENQFPDGVRRGCKITTHDPLTQTDALCGNTPDPCPWYPQLEAEVLKVPFGAPPEDVMRYFDQQESGSNPEVRAGEGWFTPLGKSLFYAHGYLHKEVLLPPGDPAKKCERLVVALFTDGLESCNCCDEDCTPPSTPPANAAGCKDGSFPRASGEPFYPTIWATKLRDNLGARVFTVGIDVDSPLLQQIANAGNGTYQNVDGTTAQLKQAFLDIIAESLPPAETCNNEDDDCDGLCDEDFPEAKVATQNGCAARPGRPCDNGLKGICLRTGEMICNPADDGVICNAPAAQGSDEECNGLDDDCDGEIDNVDPAQYPQGCTACVAQPEICNGFDDDCNDKIDDNIAQTPCGTDEGECEMGTTRCVGGALVCQGSTGPEKEICDGLDNDCDGTRDGIAEPCYTAETGCDIDTGVCQGQCNLGTAICVAEQSPAGSGNWVTVRGSCEGEIGPEPEICDGVDNNCDGLLDNGAECPEGSQCIEGQCTLPCGLGEFVCPVGQICKNDWCVLDRCDRAQCEQSGGICRFGECIDLCQGVDCPPFETCSRGRCIDDSCYEAHPCPAGQRCVAGQCADDPCAGVDCGLDELCTEGRCLTLCQRIDCPQGQSCQLVDDPEGPTTRCVVDPCAGVFCGENSVCVDGQCKVAPCADVVCDKSQICLTGSCIPNPCDRITCPADFRCESGRCVTIAESTTALLATGSGGCACSVDCGPPPLGWVLVSLFWLGGRRWRRNRRGGR